MKSTSRIELRTMIPASAMKPIIEVAVNGALEQDVADDDADEGERDRGQDHQRQAEAFELGNHQDVDAEDRHAEGRAHVAEGHPGDLPLAVPEHGRTGLVGRLAVEADVRLGQAAPSRPA